MAVHPFSMLRPIEDRIWFEVARAGATQARAVEVDAAGSADPTVRGDFLAWLLAEGASKAAPLLAQLTLLGATIEESLDLRGLRLTLTPRFVGCTLPVVELRDANAIGFEILAGTVSSVAADRLTATGALAIRATTERDRVPKDYRGAPVIECQLRFSGAMIRGNLDLRGCNIRGEGQDDGVALFADGLNVRGNALLSDRFKARGEVRLGGCQFERNLDLSGAKLQARQAYSLFAKGSQISGSLYLCRTKAWSIYPKRTGFRSLGMVTVEGARIDGDFDCSGGFFLAPELAGRWISIPDESDDDLSFAINAAGVVVRRDVLLCDGFWAKGKVCLINSRIDSDLQCGGGYFDYAASTALECDGVVVAGTTFFDKGSDLPAATHRCARTNGSIDLIYGSFKQGVQIAALEFIGTVGGAVADDKDEGNCGIDLSFASISGKLLLKGVTKAETETKTAKINLNLYQAKIDLLEDEESSWKSASFLNLTGCEYKAIKDLRPNVKERLALLDKHYVKRGETMPMQYFEPQPYLHLADVMQQSGYDEAATEIRIHLEDAHTDVGGFHRRQHFWRRVLSATIAHGYEPRRAFRWLAVAIVVSAFVFALAPDGEIIKAKDAQTTSSASLSKPSLEFSPLVYAIDMLVPLVDLHQKSNYLVQPPTCQLWVEAWSNSKTDPQILPVRLLAALWKTIVRLIGVFDPFIGWTLTSLFAAGVTGLVRRA